MDDVMSQKAVEDLVDATTLVLELKVVRSPTCNKLLADSGQHGRHFIKKIQGTVTNNVAIC